MLAEVFLSFSVFLLSILLLLILLRNKIQILHVYGKIQKVCNNNDDNLNKKRQYCIMYTTFDERRVWDV